jgi:hypothetical protein
MNNGQTEEAQIIRANLEAHGYKLIGLPEMKKDHQKMLLRYLQNNINFNEGEMSGIAKLFECKLFKNS